MKRKNLEANYFNTSKNTSNEVNVLQRLLGTRTNMSKMIKRFSVGSNWHVHFALLSLARFVICAFIYGNPRTIALDVVRSSLLSPVRDAGDILLYELKLFINKYAKKETSLPIYPVIRLLESSTNMLLLCTTLHRSAFGCRMLSFKGPVDLSLPRFMIYMKMIGVSGKSFRDITNTITNYFADQLFITAMGITYASGHPLPLILHGLYRYMGYGPTRIWSRKQPNKKNARATLEQGIRNANLLSKFNTNHVKLNKPTWVKSQLNSVGITKPFKKNQKPGYGLMNRFFVEKNPVKDLVKEHENFRKKFPPKTQGTTITTQTNDIVSSARASARNNLHIKQN